MNDRADSMQMLQAFSETYFWKPMLAFYNVFEMGALWEYFDNVALMAPVLDLGCSDGFVMSVLVGMLGLSKSDVGLDLDFGRLRLARDKGCHGALVRSIGEKLPFRDDTFGSLISLKTLDAVSDLQLVLREAGRVVRPAGTLVMTVVTETFYQHLWPYHFLRALGLHWLARDYQARVQRRFGCRYRLNADQWSAQLTAAGWIVEQVKPFFGPKAIKIHSFLLLKPLRIFGLLFPLRRYPALTLRLGRVVAWFLARFVRDTTSDADKGGMVLIVARNMRANGG